MGHRAPQKIISRYIPHISRSISRPVFTYIPSGSLKNKKELFILFFNLTTIGRDIRKTWAGYRAGYRRDIAGYYFLWDRVAHPLVRAAKSTMLGQIAKVRCRQFQG